MLQQMDRTGPSILPKHGGQQAGESLYHFAPSTGERITDKTKDAENKKHKNHNQTKCLTYQSLNIGQALSKSVIVCDILLSG
jgi:hypothetical protein